MSDDKVSKNEKLSLTSQIFTRHRLSFYRQERKVECVENIGKPPL